MVQQEQRLRKSLNHFFYLPVQLEPAPHTSHMPTSVPQDLPLSHGWPGESQPDAALRTILSCSMSSMQGPHTRAAFL
jgi:hypothetical protein